MPVQSVWLNAENLKFLQSLTDISKINATINILIRQAREADPTGAYARGVIKSYVD